MAKKKGALIKEKGQNLWWDGQRETDEKGNEYFNHLSFEQQFTCSSYLFLLSSNNR